MKNSKLKSKCKIKLFFRAESQKKNKLRLEKLKVKIDLVNSIIEETKTHLVNRVKQNQKEYKEVMKNLIVQGLIKLLEDKVNIVCRKEDVDLINDLIQRARDEFLKMLNEQTTKFKNYDCEITIDTKYFLPEYM